MSGDFELYRYTPSAVAAIIFIIIFASLCALHTFQMFRTKGWYFTAMAIGAAMEAVGYAGRALGHNDRTALGPYIMQSLMLLLAPSLFSASIYVVLGRLITVLGAEDLSLIRVRWLTAFFVTGDVLSFLIQSGGGGLMTNASSMDLGQKVILVGLVIQILWFGGFVVVSAVFHQRMGRTRVPVEHVQWTRVMYSLYLASALILIRCIFRLAEFGGGNDGVIMSHEAYLYIFDAILMTIVVAMFCYIHPPAYIQRMSKSTTSLLMTPGRSIPLRQQDSY